LERIAHFLLPSGSFVLALLGFSKAEELVECFLLPSGSHVCAYQAYHRVYYRVYLSTPFREFPLQYALLSSRNYCVEILSTPFWEFQDFYLRLLYPYATDGQVLSTPFWDFHRTLRYTW